MRFFMMEQNRLLADTIRFRDFDIQGARHLFCKEDAGIIQDSAVLYLAEGSGEAFPDFIQSPVSMVSDMVKKVLDMYEDGMIFKTVTIAGKEQEVLKVYHHLLPEKLDMLSGQSEFYPNGSVKRLVLDAQKIGEHKVFLLDDRRFRNPFVSLEVVESLLRRRAAGIIWREVEVSSWQN